MKFLTALMFLVSATAFGDVGGKIKCYEAAQQGGDAEVAYGMYDKGGDYLWLKYPENMQGKLYPHDGCLKQSTNGTDELVPRLKFCPTDGQEINDLIPVEVSYGYEEETVYCERELEDWFKKYPVL